MAKFCLARRRPLTVCFSLPQILRKSSTSEGLGPTLLDPPCGSEASSLARFAGLLLILAAAPRNTAALPGFGPTNALLRQQKSFMSEDMLRIKSNAGGGQQGKAGRPAAGGRGENEEAGEGSRRRDG